MLCVEGLATCVPVRPWLCGDCWKLRTVTWASLARRKVCLETCPLLCSLVFVTFFHPSVVKLRNVVTLLSSCSVRSRRVPQQAFPAPESGVAPQNQVSAHFLLCSCTTWCCSSSHCLFFINVVHKLLFYFHCSFQWIQHSLLIYYTDLLLIFNLVVVVKTWRYLRLHQHHYFLAFPAFFWDKVTELRPAKVHFSSHFYGKVWLWFHIKDRKWV